MANKTKIVLWLAIAAALVHILDAFKVSALMDLVQKSWYNLGGFADISVQLLVGVALVILAVMQLKKA